MIDRRRFLHLGVGAAVGISATASAGTAQLRATEGESRVRRYARLGRTEMRVSDISFGSSQSSDADLFRYAYDHGVNYFDTAESYRFGGAEEAIGEALRGVRDQVLLASKTKAGAADNRARMMAALEATLRRLRTDYLDVYFNHAVNDPRRMQNQEWWEFTELARRQGKIRFRGMSGHGSRLVECLGYALEQDLVDVVLVAFNFGQDPDFYDRIRHTFHFVDLQPELPEVLDRARRKDVGVLAMKTLMGARLNDMRPYEHGGATYAQAALRWVLATGKADALLISMTSRERIDEYLRASGAATLSGADLELLGLYAVRNGPSYCRPGCGACEESCPHGVPIAEVLRTRMYEVDYRDHTMARIDYEGLGDGAGACFACAHQSCLGSCPVGLPIARLTRDTARRLG